MGKITDITPQKKDKKRVNIFIDQDFAFGVSIELKFEKKLEVGKLLSERQVVNIVEDDQVERLFNKSLRLLSYRPRSEKEIRDHLLRKGKLRGLEKSEFEDSQYENSIEKALLKLKRLKQIDDKEFTVWWIDQRKKFKTRGVRAIKMELVQKGVDKDIISELLDQDDEEAEEELAVKASQKKIGSYNKLDKYEFRNKMGQYLSRRGFGWSTIKKVVDTLSKNR